MNIPKRIPALVAGVAALAAACSEAITTPSASPEVSPRPAASVSAVGSADLVSLLATTVYASQVVSASPGLRKDGNPITNPDRIDPTNALGAPDTKFFSLGFGGTLVVKFDAAYRGSLLVTWETTINPVAAPYGKEVAEVYVSADGVAWTLVGEVTNQNDLGSPVHQSKVTLPVGCWRYAKVVDKSDKANFTDAVADGFDVESIGIEDAVACGAPAGCSHGYYKNHTVAGENNTFGFYGVTNSGRTTTTLKQALSFGGGPSLQDAKDNMLKQLAASILNSIHVASGFPLSTTQLVNQANAALATNNRATILAFASVLDGYNNLGCTLSK